MAQKKNDQDITVIAQCFVESELGRETIISFDKAWHRMLDLASVGHVPVSSGLIKFVPKRDL